MTRQRRLTADSGTLQRLHLETSSVVAQSRIRSLERRQTAILARIEQLNKAMENLRIEYAQLDTLVCRAKAEKQIYDDCVRAMGDEL